MKKVSIIVCGYNEEKYVEECLLSLINQTYSDIEIIFIDDGSNDRTIDIVRKYEEKGIILLQNKKNSGSAYSRNAGMRIATGEYIGFLDADDVAVLNRIEIQVNYLNEHTEVGLVGGECDFIDKNGVLIRPSNRLIPHTIEGIRTSMLFGNVLPTGGVLFRRKIIDEYKVSFDEEFITSQDYKFWISCLRYCDARSLKTVVYHYRIGHGSKSEKNKNNNIEKYENAIKEILMLAWYNEGFILSIDDIESIYNCLFLGKININNIRLFYKTKHKIAKQLKNKDKKFCSELKKQIRIRVLKNVYACLICRA